MARKYFAVYRLLITVKNPAFRLAAALLPALALLLLPSSMNAETPAPAKIETAIVGGGCFWCVEGCFLIVPGVTKVVSGYAGGTIDNPPTSRSARGRRATPRWPR